MQATLLLPTALFERYQAVLPEGLVEAVGKKTARAVYEPGDFEYYIQSSATYSSSIEGNSIDIDTYMQNKRFKIKSKPKEMAEIDDLVAAYNHAMGNNLNKKSFFGIT